MDKQSNDREYVMRIIILCLFMVVGHTSVGDDDKLTDWLQPKAPSPFAGGALSMPPLRTESEVIEAMEIIAVTIVDSRLGGCWIESTVTEMQGAGKHNGAWFARLQLKDDSDVWMEVYVDKNGQIKELNASEYALKLSIGLGYWIREDNRATVLALHKDLPAYEIEKEMMALTALDMARILGRSNCTWHIRNIRQEENGSWVAKISSFNLRENVTVKLSVHGNLHGFFRSPSTE